MFAIVTNIPWKCIKILQSSLRSGEKGFSLKQIIRGSAMCIWRGPGSILILIHSLVLRLSGWMNLFFLNNVLTVQEGETMLCAWSMMVPTPTVPQVVLMCTIIVRKVRNVGQANELVFFWQSSGLHLENMAFIHWSRYVCYLLGNILGSEEE